MRSPNTSLTAGYGRSRSRRSILRAFADLPEDFMLKIGTLLVGWTLVLTLAVFAFGNRQDEELASAGIDIEQLVGEVR